MGGVILESHSIRANHTERWNSQFKGPDVKTNCVCVSSSREQRDSERRTKAEAAAGTDRKGPQNEYEFCSVCDGKPLEL